MKTPKTSVRKSSKKPAPKKMGTVSTAPYRSPAFDYAEPRISKVATSISSDDPNFVLPQMASSLTLKAWLPESGALTMPFRGMGTVDCGIDVRLPAGYKLVVKANPMMEAKGLFVSQAACDGTRVKVNLLNLSREIVVIRHGDSVASLEVEPMYFFDWAAQAVGGK